MELCGLWRTRCCLPLGERYIVNAFHAVSRSSATKQRWKRASSSKRQEAVYLVLENCEGFKGPPLSGWGFLFGLPQTHVINLIHSSDRLSNPALSWAAQAALMAYFSEWVIPTHPVIFHVSPQFFFFYSRASDWGLNLRFQTFSCLTCIRLLSTHGRLLFINVSAHHSHVSDTYPCISMIILLS